MAVMLIHVTATFSQHVTKVKSLQFDIMLVMLLQEYRVI